MSKSISGSGSLNLTVQELRFLEIKATLISAIKNLEPSHKHGHIQNPSTCDRPHVARAAKENKCCIAEHQTID